MKFVGKRANHAHRFDNKNDNRNQSELNGFDYTPIEDELVEYSALDIDDSDFDFESELVLDAMDDDENSDTLFDEFSAMQKSDADALSPWFYSLLSIFTNDSAKASQNESSKDLKNAKPTKNGKSVTARTPVQTVKPVKHAKKNAPCPLEALKLSPEKHLELNHTLVRLLDALRAHATLLFSTKMDKQDEIYKLNKKHVHLVESIKALMPLQTIRMQQINALRDSFDNATEGYGVFESKYSTNKNVMKFIDSWHENVVGTLDELYAFLEVIQDEMMSEEANESVYDKVSNDTDKFNMLDEASTDVSKGLFSKTNKRASIETSSQSGSPSLTDEKIAYEQANENKDNLTPSFNFTNPMGN